MAEQNANRKPEIVATYPYTDESGKLLYQVVRFDPKNFRQRVPNGNGWAYSLNGTRRVLYRLPELLASVSIVWLVEGEKDADSLASLGLTATTAAMGAGNWRTEYAESLRGRHVIIIPDNDEPGHKHGKAVSKALDGIAASVIILELPGLPPKGDVSDWLDAGGTIDKLLALAQSAEAIADAKRTAPHEQKKLPDEARPVLITLADVESREITWLWHKWLPRGAITILDGDPGLGKSTVTIDLAARVSRGWEMPPAGGPCCGAEPESVLILNAEDDPGNTIRPRLEAAGADLTRVHLFDRVETGTIQRPPILPFDLERVKDEIKAREVALVIVDPFLAFLDGEIDAHKDQDVRRCLHRLKEIAQETGAAILLVRHLNKMGHNTAMYRGGGSIGITGAARSALLIGRHPDDAAVRVIASTKSNLGPCPRALTYHLEPSDNVARIAWGEEIDLTANDILSHPTAYHKQGAGDQAAAAIKELLVDGPMESNTLDESLVGQGYSKRAIKEGRKTAKVKAFRETFSGKWKVSLPDSAQEVQ